MVLDDYQRLTDVIESDKKAGDRKTEAKAEDAEPAATGEGTAQEDASDDCGHDHAEPIAEGAADADKSSEVENSDGRTDSEKPTQKPKEFHSKEEKRDYAWKELTRKNAELKRRIRELEAKEERYKASASTPVKRENFQNEDDFRNAAFDQMMDMRALRDNSEALNEARERLGESEAEEVNYRVRDNIARLFPTEEARKEYRDAINEAVKYGFGQFLEQTVPGQEINDFCINSPVGSAIMFHLARHAGDFKTLMADPSSQRRTARLISLEANIGKLYARDPNKGQPKAKEVAPPSETRKENKLPRMGNLKNTAPAGEPSDDDLIAFVRQFG